MKPVKTKTTVCFIVLVVLICNPALATVRHVPEQYATIQAAIDASKDSDTVVIAQGRHSGPGNYNISLDGKQITVRSTDPTDANIVANTIINCGGLGRRDTQFFTTSASITSSWPPCITIQGDSISANSAKGYILTGGATRRSFSALMVSCARAVT